MSEHSSSKTDGHTILDSIINEDEETDVAKPPAPPHSQDSVFASFNWTTDNDYTFQFNAFHDEAGHFPPAASTAGLGGLRHVDDDEDLNRHEINYDAFASPPASSRGGKSDQFGGMLLPNTYKLSPSSPKQEAPSVSIPTEKNDARNAVPVLPLAHMSTHDSIGSNPEAKNSRDPFSPFIQFGFPASTEVTSPFSSARSNKEHKALFQATPSLTSLNDVKQWMQAFLAKSKLVSHFTLSVVGPPSPSQAQTLSYPLPAIPQNEAWDTCSATSFNQLFSILQLEGCAVCGSISPPSSVVGHSSFVVANSFISLTCTRLGCQHVGHTCCMLLASSISLRTHSSHFFQTVVSSLSVIESQQQQLAASSSVDRKCHLELYLIHTVSDISLTSGAFPQSFECPIVTLADGDGEVDAALLAPIVNSQQQVQPRFLLNKPKGRLGLRCLSINSEEQWQSEGLFDLSSLFSPPTSPPPSSSQLAHNFQLLQLDAKHSPSLVADSIANLVMVDNSISVVATLGRFVDANSVPQWGLISLKAELPSPAHPPNMSSIAQPQPVMAAEFSHPVLMDQFEFDSRASTHQMFTRYFSAPPVKANQNTHFEFSQQQQQQQQQHLSNETGDSNMSPTFMDSNRFSSHTQDAVSMHSFQSASPPPDSARKGNTMPNLHIPIEMQQELDPLLLQTLSLYTGKGTSPLLMQHSAHQPQPRFQPPPPQNRSFGNHHHTVPYVKPEFVPVSTIHEASVDKLLPHVEGRVCILAKSQCGSRFLQQKLLEGDPQYFALIYDEMFPQFGDLMTDLFGNYLCQILIEKCDDMQLQALVSQVRPFLPQISCDRQGTRAVQKLISCCKSPKLCNAVMNALMPKLHLLMRDPSGSHVVHALLDYFDVPLLDPIFAVVIQNTLELALDQHGLCVLKKCVTLTSGTDFKNLAHQIIKHVMDLVNNQYGNYLVQHLIDQKDAECNQVMHKRLQGFYAMLSKQKFSSNVVEKCLRSGDELWKAEIIEELMTDDAITSLLQDSYGNYVMQNALYVANRQQAQALVDVIHPRLHTLRKNIQLKWERLLKESIAGTLALKTNLTKKYDKFVPRPVVPEMMPRGGKDSSRMSADAPVFQPSAAPLYQPQPSPPSQMPQPSPPSQPRFYPPQPQSHQFFPPHYPPMQRTPTDPSGYSMPTNQQFYSHPPPPAMSPQHFAPPPTQFAPPPTQFVPPPTQFVPPPDPQYGMYPSSSQPFYPPSYPQPSQPYFGHY